MKPVSVVAPGWKKAVICRPDGNKLVEFEASGSTEIYGLSELFFEGAEPPLAEQSLDEVLPRFPEGEYIIVGETVEGEALMSTATFTHDSPDDQGGAFLGRPLTLLSMLESTADLPLRPVSDAPPELALRTVLVEGALWAGASLLLAGLPVRCAWTCRQNCPFAGFWQPAGRPSWQRM